MLPPPPVPEIPPGDINALARAVYHRISRELHGHDFDQSFVYPTLQTRIDRISFGLPTTVMIAGQDLERGLLGTC